MLRDAALRSSRARRAAWLVAGVVAVAIGVHAQTDLLRYEFTPGPKLAPARDWPPEAGFARSTTHATLVAFMHPRCPCSRASLTELASIARACDERLDVHVVFAVDAEHGLTLDAEGGESRTLALAIPRAHVHVDDGARVAAAFGARTSGHCFVYGPSGQLEFEGGVTNARGHVGRSVAAGAIENLAAARAPRLASTPVFGCGLAREAASEGGP